MEGQGEADELMYLPPPPEYEEYAAPPSEGEDEERERGASDLPPYDDQMELPPPPLLTPPLLENGAHGASNGKLPGGEQSATSTPSISPTISPPISSKAPRGQTNRLRSLPSNFFSDLIGQEKTEEPVKPRGSLGTPVSASVVNKDCKVFVKVVEAKNLQGKKKRDKIKKKNSGLVRKGSAMLMDLSSPNLVHLEKVSADPYAIVMMNDQKFRTRAILQQLNPFWCEEYTLDVEGNPADSIIKIAIWDYNKFEPDEFMGKLLIPVSALKECPDVEQWYPLFPMSAKVMLGKNELDGGIKHMQSQGFQDPKLGTIRVKFRYTEEIILEASEYNDFVEMLTDDKLTIIKLLGRTTSEREILASIFIKVFQVKGKALFLVKQLVGDEIDSTDNPDIIFRGNSLATKVVDLYMKFLGFPYLRTALETLIKRIYTWKKSCEVDPTKLNKEDDVKRNTKRLKKWIKKVLACILDSYESCPPEFRAVFHHIQSKVQDKYSAEQANVTKYTAVSGFTFLRFFCPAILGPKLFKLVDEHPDLQTNRTLILIAKTLQNIANLVEFSGDKEPYMSPLNELVQSYMIPMKEFIDEISNPALSFNVLPTKSPPVHLEKELASLYRHCKQGMDKMYGLATGSQIQELHRLSEILGALAKAEEREKQKGSL